MRPKRKSGHPVSESSNDHERHAVAHMVDTSKRARRSSNDENGSALNRLNSQAPQDRREEEIWETVTSRKKSRREQERRPNSDKRFAAETQQIKINFNKDEDLRISDLRDLALYVLTDSVAPRWAAVKNAKDIQKVIVLMVPGLDKSLLQRSQRLSSLGKDSSTDHDEQETSEAVADSTDIDGNFLNKKHLDHLQTETNDRPQYLSNRTKRHWLEESSFSVRATGDTKFSRINSPLQTMIFVPETPATKKAYRDKDKSDGSTKTPITEFVHSPTELREAGYPIHPASFTSLGDAVLEAQRREAANQTAENDWFDTSVTDTSLLYQGAHECTAYALDCEMVLTEDETMSLARVSVVSWPHGEVILDKLVRPVFAVTNYFTQYSGMTEARLRDVTTTLNDIQKELASLFTSTTILLGHSLESDLNALKMTHPFVIDTSLIFPHPRGFPLRSSLKYLANKYLKREIQLGGANGHDSVEDARAVLDLVKVKCEKGSNFGTMEANGETIFKRLSQNSRTSAMVEYGTPQRGFGKDASYTIGCQNDEEIAAGVVRAVKGDEVFDFGIPKGGADLVWGRLRALEFARGWVTGPQSSTPVATPAARRASGLQQKKTDADPDPDPDPDPDVNPLSSLDPVLKSTLHNLDSIHASLPPRTLLLVYSGTGDVRPLMRLQAQQQEYRREFKTKKWDELSVQWTDAEEQAMRKAYEEARKGWGAIVLR